MGRSSGILPCQVIESLIETGAIAADREISPEQVQPASLDLRLGERAFRVRASFLPGPGAAMAARLERLSMHEIDLSQGAVLERGCVYVVEIAERLDLPPKISGRANPKSSIGRLDVFVRLICEGADAFDRARPGYEGRLWLEIAPQTFAILVRAGDRLAQMRFRQGPQGPVEVRDVRVGLGAGPDGEPCGFRARRHAGVIDLARNGGHDPAQFFEALSAPGGELLLDPGEFYILASREGVEVGPEEAAEMSPIDPAVGEFRAHYAGFFDPGFGLASGGQGLAPEGVPGGAPGGAKAVLEVRSREAPFLLEDGQIVARLAYEPLIEPPSRLYGQGNAGGHYQSQALALSRFFAPWPV